MDRDTETDADSDAALPLRRVFSIGLGNALEFYDFLSFSFFSIQIGHAFFPQEQTTHGLLFTLATFGVGFATRPLGGLIIGRYGDRAGRRPAMMLSFTLMGLAMLGVALTPPFARIGVAAPILLLVFRLIQGFALGGEVGPSTAYLVEVAPPLKRGLYVSVQYVTQDLSILASGIVGFTLSNALSPKALDEWGWRLAMLLGVAIVPVGLWLRRALPESLPARPAGSAPSAAPRVPVRLVALGLLLLGATTISSYVLNYLTTYAQDALKMDTRLAFVATIVVGLAEALGDLSAGLLSDRIGRRPLMVGAFVVLAALTLPSFMAMNRAPSVGVAFAAMGLISVVSSLAGGPILVAITETLPRAIRCGTLATLYAVAIACFGGSTQFMVKWLSDLTGSTLAPGWYMTGAILVGTCAALMMRESAPRKTGVSALPVGAADASGAAARA